MQYKVTLGRFSRRGIQNFTTLGDASGSSSFNNGDVAYLIDYSQTSGVDGVIIRSGKQAWNVVPPASATDAIADGDIDLSGEWDGGAKIRISQDGDSVNIRSFINANRLGKILPLAPLQNESSLLNSRKQSSKAPLMIQPTASTGPTVPLGPKKVVVNHGDIRMAID